MINVLAVLVAGVAIFMLGGLWYSPILFAKPWVRLVGKTEEELKAAAGSMPASYAMVFLCGLVTAYGLAVVFARAHPTSIGDALGIAAICWLAFAGATSFGTSLFGGKPRALWLIDSGYNLVAFLVGAAILSAWR